MRLRPILAALCCAMLLGACSTRFSPFPVSPKPGAALLLPCVPPRVVADVEAATDNDLALMMLGLGRAYAECERRQADLVKWVREQ